MLFFLTGFVWKFYQEYSRGDTLDLSIGRTNEQERET